MESNQEVFKQALFIQNKIELDDFFRKKNVTFGGEEGEREGSQNWNFVNNAHTESFK